MTLSQLDLEDVEALHLGPSFLTADTMGPLLDQCKDLFPLSSLEEPPSGFHSLCPDSPLHSHHALIPEVKVSDWVLPLLGASDLLNSHSKYDQEEDDAFTGMDWVSEKLDLSELDLDSLMDSSDDCPDSPEGLLAHRQHTELRLFNTEISTAPSRDLSLASEVPETKAGQVHIKIEPVSPASSLELGSEVDVGEAERAVMITESSAAPYMIPDKRSQSDCDSDSGIESSVSSSPPHTPASSRAKPYSRPETPNTKAPKIKSVSGAPKSVDKKLKKMEQNKTAATRYRQKKRVEQDLLNVECDELEKKNRELTEKAESISREIQYLKDLMEEVRRHHQSKSRAVLK